MKRRGETAGSHRCAALPVHPSLRSGVLREEYFVTLDAPCGSTSWRAQPQRGASRSGECFAFLYDPKGAPLRSARTMRYARRWSICPPGGRWGIGKVQGDLKHCKMRRWTAGV